MDYKLLKEDDDAYHLMDPKGKEMRVAKQALSDALHEKIRGYANGGEVESAPEKEPFKTQNLFEKIEYGIGRAAEPFIGPFMSGGAGAEGQSNYQKMLEDRIVSSRARQFPDTSPGIKPIAPGGAMSNLTASTVEESGLPVGPVNAPGVPVGGEATPVAAAPLDPSALIQQPSVPGGGGGMDAAFNKMSAANKIAADAQKNYYTEAEQAQIKQNERIEQIDLIQRQENESMVKQQDDFMNKVMTHEIQPNRIWANASTGSQISAAIGVLLGGLGAGLTGGPNQAMAVINRLVDQDIDAQKAELGKKQTLYSMNLQKYRDAQTAHAATKAQSAAMLQGQLAVSAARMGSQQAQAAKLQADAVIEQERAKLNQQVVAAQSIKALMAHIGKTGEQGYIEFLPEAQRKEAYERVVPGVGLASTKEGAAKANELVTSTRSGVELINELKSFAGKTGSKFSMEDKAKAETLARMIMGQIREGVLGPGTVNEGERKILEKMVANPTNLMQLPGTALKTLNTVIESLETRQRHALKQFGLNPPAKLDRGAPVR